MLSASRLPISNPVEFRTYVDTFSPLPLYFLRVDAEGFVYGIRQHSVLKLSPEGKVVTSFGERALGNAQALYWLDQNTKLVVFYPEVQQVIFLDRDLAELYRLAIRETGVTHASAIAPGEGRVLWLYDSRTHRLVAYHYALKRILKSSLIPEQLGFYPSITLLYVYKRLILASDTQRRVVFIFGPDGFLIRRLQTRAWWFSTPVPNQLFIHTDGSFMVFEQVPGYPLRYTRRIRYWKPSCDARGTFWLPDHQWFVCDGILWHRYRKRITTHATDTTDIKTDTLSTPGNRTSEQTPR